MDQAMQPPVWGSVVGRDEQIARITSNPGGIA